MKIKIISSILLVTIIFAFYDGTEAMRKQGVAVKGKLVCGSQPAGGGNTTKVRIVDIDTGKKILETSKI